MKHAITPLVLSTATFGLMLGVPQNAQASGLIRNVTATTNLVGATTSSNLLFTTNGAGLPLGTPSLTGTHEASTGTNAWRSANNFPSSTGVFEFAFNRIYNLAGFSFWNSGGGTVAADVGINAVKIEYRLGTGGTWTTLSGAPSSFAKGASSGNVAVQQFSFTPVLATNVRFSNMTNQGGSGSNNRIGFSEIQFRSIPEPSSTLALLALGLAGVGLKKRI
ncbi:MAG: PEP-CTERM sorting domain-containing protein [Microcystis sp. M015S2]|uniref:PEP-CTERM sorting domain-containing protein n=1 Tax=unclassified Microcystis TaxID=2643300 RepID=UPI0025868387|nr:MULTISPECIES: PEP-CTERM sorting domain-containing protein [unclassified Microcystis]MCA2709955.1 PEP-CTERM sorting domain-containing protein [Microcystis sp. M025S2]MCA2742174.1 PEP-CTERM sorting domain-containing protein [Microcystis sp. M015S2]MCA2757810.1 PEP-CTERM sorting domain-containing protein [Microcystis sp. M145S2]